MKDWTRGGDSVTRAGPCGGGGWVLKKKKKKEAEVYYLRSGSTDEDA